MNKSIFSKNKLASKNNYFNSGINLNDLSATSSVFMSNIRPNLKGGAVNNYNNNDNCPCEMIMKSLNSGNNEAIEFALYEIKKGNCCYKCVDSKGDTVFTKLCKCENDICKKSLADII